jgi:hypothetical protein
MANEKKEKLPEPKFIDQAFAIIDKKYLEAKNIKNPKDGPGIQIWDHKLWVMIMDLHVQHVNDVLVKGFGEKVAEHYGPIMEALKRLEFKQDTLSNEVHELATREREDVTRLEEKIQHIIKRLDAKKTKIAELERKQFNIAQLEKAGEVVLSFGKKIRSLYIFAVLIGIGFAIGGLLLIGHLIGWW